MQVDTGSNAPGGAPATEINVNTPAEVTTPETNVNVNVGTEKPA